MKKKKKILREKKKKQAGNCDTHLLWALLATPQKEGRRGEAQPLYQVRSGCPVCVLRRRCWRRRRRFTAPRHQAFPQSYFRTDAVLFPAAKCCLLTR